MKIRCDFVSNSSSSSFCVKDIKKAIQLINDLGYIPYQIDDNLTFNISYYHKDVKEIYEEILNQKYDETIGYYWDHKKIQPDEIEYAWHVDIYKLQDALKNNKKILDKIIDVSIVTAENNNLANAVLYMLYKYFELKGLNPDSSVTEINFLDNDFENDNFIIKLFTKIKDLKKEAVQKCQKV